MIVHLGYKRLTAFMAELIAIEHTHETAIITFLTGGHGLEFIPQAHRLQ